MLVDHIDRNKMNNHFSNLRWVTDRESMTNRVNTIRVNFEGEDRPLIDVCRQLGFEDNTYRKIRYRLLKGYSLEEAIKIYK